MAGEITLEQKDGIATVTFNRPERRNAIGYHGWLELRRMVTAVAGDGGAKMVVFTGSGDEAFSAGADIKDFDQYRDDSVQAKKYQEAFDGAVDAIESLPQPTICLIRGVCVGGGCELSLAADVRIAADNSRFGIPAARLGIIIGYREMRRLINLVGPGHSAYILLSGRLIDAEEAMRIGLVNQVVPLDEIEEYVHRLATEMSRLASLSHRQHKQVLQTVLWNPSLTGLTHDEEQLPFANFDSEDYREGRRAFKERREPNFVGK